MIVQQAVVHMLLTVGICLGAFAQERTLTVTGKLMHVMAIGGESTGWAVQLDSTVTIDGKELNSLELSTGNMTKLKALANKQVVVTGKITHRSGVERGERTVLNISSIAEAQAKSSKADSAAETVPAGIDLIHTKWLLEDLAGSGVIDNVQATLEFPQADKVSGYGSCNRFFGSVNVTQNRLEFGALGSTRKACSPALMNQEAKYLAALGAVKHFEWKAPFLLLYTDDKAQPLRFTRFTGKN